MCVCAGSKKKVENHRIRQSDDPNGRKRSFVIESHGDETVDRMLTHFSND